MIKQVKKQIQQHLYVLTRSQKRKLEADAKQRKREERKETVEEEKIWDDVKEEVFSV